MTAPVKIFYEAVAAGATDQTLGATGSLDDRLDAVIVSVSAAATGTCSIKDGNGAAMPLTEANAPIGVYTVTFPRGIKAINATTPGWKITTGAGATAIGVGEFT